MRQQSNATFVPPQEDDFINSILGTTPLKHSALLLSAKMGAASAGVSPSLPPSADQPQGSAAFVAVAGAATAASSLLSSRGDDASSTVVASAEAPRAVSPSSVSLEASAHPATSSATGGVAPGHSTSRRSESIPSFTTSPPPSPSLRQATASTIGASTGSGSGNNFVPNSHSPRSNQISSSKRFGYGATVAGEGSTSDINASDRRARAQGLLGYTLLFVNFSLNVAGLLLIAIGIVTRTNSAIGLCDSCKKLTIAPIVSGMVLWLCSTYGFNWIRRKNILMMLIYGGVLVLLVLTLIAIMFTAVAFEGEVNKSDAMLQVWKQLVTDDPHSLCTLQARFNCSGYFYGCCKSDLDWRSSEPSTTASSSAVASLIGGPEMELADSWRTLLGNASGGKNSTAVCFGQNGSVPFWAPLVCPTCPGLILNNTVVCTDVVYRTLRRNLLGFTVIMVVASLMIFVALSIAVLLRHREAAGGDADASEDTASPTDGHEVSPKSEGLLADSVRAAASASPKRLESVRLIGVS